jgi:lipopolysaccharide/colanic/teichoic acid biosynthesis glycosyltransferase
MLSLFLFLFFMPVMTVIALVILIYDGWPVLFVHRRVGKNGKLFCMPKFRTMQTDANPYIPSTKFEENNRTTKSGRFLRQHRLDELPQLFSVIVGQMTLIGPRPDIPNVVATYRHIHRKRLLSKSGVTGLWQIFGNREKAMHEGIKYDLYYIRRARIWLDIRIAVITVLFMINPKLVKN